MKYIDADLLRKEIDKWTGAMSDNIEDDYSDGMRFALNHFVFILNSLQQEQQDILVLNKKDWEEQEQFRKDKKFGIPLQQEQLEDSKGKFVFPKFLYARTLDNKTIDVSYVPQSVEAIEYARNDSIEEQPEMDFEKELDRIWFDNKFGNRFDNSAVDFANVRWICKHFYELGRRLCSK